MSRPNFSYSADTKAIAKERKTEEPKSLVFSSISERKPAKTVPILFSKEGGSFESKLSKLEKSRPRPAIRASLSALSKSIISRSLLESSFVIRSSIKFCVPAAVILEVRTASSSFLTPRFAARAFSSMATIKFINAALKWASFVLSSLKSLPGDRLGILNKAFISTFEKSSKSFKSAEGAEGFRNLPRAAGGRALKSSFKTSSSRPICLEIACQFMPAPRAVFNFS